MTSENTPPREVFLASLDPEAEDRAAGVAMTTLEMALLLAQTAADDKKNHEQERGTFRVIASLLRLAVQEEHDLAR